jgi:hypothetical protein
MINNVRNTVLAIINKENNGYITPDEFNLFATQAQSELFEEYFKSYALAVQMVNSRQYGTGHADLLKRLEEVIDYFVIPDAVLTYLAGVYALPTDSYKTNYPIYNGRKIEVVSYDKILELNSSNLTAPSTLYPSCTISARELTVYPSTIQSGVTLNYIRYPRTPKWTYVVVPGSDAPLFNPAAVDYSDFELPLSDEMNLIVRILQMAGISIREEEVVQAAKSEELHDKQEQ